MKKSITMISVLMTLLALLLAACSLDDPADPTGRLNDPTPADASTPYVAIGNSLTAGYMDSGLMKAGQANSYPMIVASQMGLADSFTQPWVDFPGIGTTSVGAGNTSGVLYYSEPGGTPTVLPRAITPSDEVAGLLLAVAQPTQYHNLGVPGAFTYDLMNTYSGASWSAAPPFNSPNTFFEFINRAGSMVGLFKNVDVPAMGPAPGYQTGSQFYQTIAKGPALVTAWIGGNDFLFGATTGEPMGPASALITDAADFAAYYGGFLHSLAGGLLGRNGFSPTIITATLPSVRNIPFFLDRPTFTAVFGGGYTFAEADAQYILFTDFLASGLLGNPTGELGQELTLDVAETDYLNNDVVGAYNTAIKTVTAQVNGNPDVPVDADYVDIDQIMDDLRLADANALRHFILLRIMAGFAEPISDTAAKTIFSLDGVHPNNKGYAFVANAFLAKINEVTGSDWAQVPLEAFTYDPTYGAPTPTFAGGATPSGITPEVAASMKSNF